MTSSLEVFQDLNLHARSADHSLRDALLKQVRAPWRHEAEREESIASNMALRHGDVIALVRDATGAIPGASLVLWPQDGGGYRIANIVPRKTGQLSTSQYNAILQDFVRSVAEPAKADGHFEIELTSPDQSMSDWIGEEATRALVTFSQNANKSTGASHPMDQTRWMDFIIKAYRTGGRTLDSSRLARWLREVEGWDESTAFELAIEFEFSLDLLTHYDKSKQ